MQQTRLLLLIVDVTFIMMSTQTRRYAAPWLTAVLAALFLHTAASPVDAAVAVQAADTAGDDEDADVVPS